MAGDAARIDRFLEMMAAESGAAANTIAAYGSDLRLASVFLQGRLGEAAADDLARLGDEWRALSRASVARKSAALRRFFAFLADEGLRPDDPRAALPPPGTARPFPKVLTRADVDRLFGAIAARIARVPPDPNDLRLAALVELLYGSGLRASELVSLPRNAVAPDRPFLILKGKGGRERLVPISDRARGSGRMARACCRRSAVAVPLGQGAFVPHPALSAHQGARRRGWHSARPHQPACPASRLCHAPSRRRSGPARVAGDAGPCRYRHDADLHPCRQPSVGRAGQRAASACRARPS
jgi:integrase